MLTLNLLRSAIIVIALMFGSILPVVGSRVAVVLFVANSLSTLDIYIIIMLFQISIAFSIIYIHHS